MDLNLEDTNKEFTIKILQKLKLLVSCKCFYVVLNSKTQLAKNKFVSLCIKQASLPSSLTGEWYIGIPLDFRVNVEVFRSLNKFSWDEVIDDWRDLKHKNKFSLATWNFEKICRYLIKRPLLNSFRGQLGTMEKNCCV